MKLNTGGGFCEDESKYWHCRDCGKEFLNSRYENKAWGQR